MARAWPLCDKSVKAYRLWITSCSRDRDGLTPYNQSSGPTPMALSSGTHLGPYEITAQIGVGGMGEVYRATNTKLKREVAVKVLSSAFAADPERLLRFQRKPKGGVVIVRFRVRQLHGGGTLFSGSIWTGDVQFRIIPNECLL